MKFILSFLICCLGATGIANGLPCPPYCYGLESKIKYHRYNKCNHTEMQTAAHANISTDNAWIESKVKFTLKDPDTRYRNELIVVDKLIMGYKPIDANGVSLKIQAGRAPMDSLFNSQIQFGSPFTGVMAIARNSDFELALAGNLINAEKDHAGMILQASYSNPLVSPHSLRYSLTNWTGAERYVVSQLGSELYLPIFSNQFLKAYGAFLRNHKQSAHSNALYAGVALGELDRASDFMVDVCYQYTGRKAIPSFDYNGIKRGPHMQQRTAALQLKAGYAVTDHLSLQTKAILAKDNLFEMSAVYKM